MAQIDFTGNVGKDAELRFTKSGIAVLGFTACDSKSRKNDQGGWDTISEQWFAVSLWGEAAEQYAGKIVKGSRVRVFGEFYKRDYESQNGGGTSLDVRANAVEIIPKRNTQQGGGFGGQQGGNAGGEWSQQGAGGWGNTGNPGGDEPPF